MEKMEFNGSPIVGMVRFLFDISKDFFPHFLACLLRKLTNPCACFEVLSAVFRYRPRDVCFGSQSKGEVETLDTIA